MTSLEVLAPGVRRLAVSTPTLPPATHTNVWILGQARLTVVEPASPWPDEQERLLEALTSLDGQVERIVLTHHHADHIGGVEALREQLLPRQIPVLAHPRTATLLEGQVVVDAFLDEGDVLDIDGAAWSVMHVPGHASGHIVLLDATTGTMVAGDMVAGVGTVLIPPDDGDLGDYLAGLARMAAARPTVLLPSHGPALHEAPAILGFYVAHRHQRSDQIRRALQAQGPLSADGLVEPVYGTSIPPEAHPVAAVQILAHLHWLVKQGLAQAASEGRFAASS